MVDVSTSQKMQFFYVLLFLIDKIEKNDGA